MPMLEKEKLAYFEKLLQSMRKELLRESLKKRLDEVDDESEVAKDPVDIASDERGKDLSLILSDRDQEKLEAIDEALERIRHKAYGICSECGKDIPEGRLKIMPTASLCVECKEEIEREEQLRPFLGSGEKYLRPFDVQGQPHEEEEA